MLEKKVCFSEIEFANCDLFVKILKWINMRLSFSWTFFFLIMNSTELVDFEKNYVNMQNLLNQLNSANLSECAEFSKLG